MEKKMYTDSHNLLTRQYSKVDKLKQGSLGYFT